MKRGLLAVIPLLVLFLSAACDKRQQIPDAPVSINEAVGPIVLHASLQDTLSPAFLQALRLGKVEGLNVKYLSGREAHYFAYIADPDAVLRAVARTAFSKHVVVADTVCRRIDARALDVLAQPLHATELAAGAFFWQADAAGLEAYECVRGPVRHTLLIRRATHTVLHRVEFSA
ncbi:hypothetical protein [Dawidia soli]|uniref:Uncharacterized protein n=1 Tax=Dawidia soli TaxID=2782352 RepID=A0AAP2DBM4_9BACT|nr:hypothetical protein [Dawidia soli]MBT1688457.1 hypothetical protein [Dawidia soli]